MRGAICSIELLLPIYYATFVQPVSEVLTLRLIVQLLLEIMTVITPYAHAPLHPGSF